MRTTTIIQSGLNDDELRDKLGSIFLTKGYALQNYKKCKLWKKGNGWLTAPQLFNIYKKDNKLHIETWIPFALLPGIYLGESGLDSGFGIAVKLSMRKILTEIVNAIKLDGTEPEGYMPKK